MDPVKKIYIGTLAAIIIILLTANIVEAQFYLTGEDPARAKWNQIATPNYKVIYPQGTDSLAHRYARLLEGERAGVMAGVMANPKPIPVVLHPFTTVSNGMVVWAPKRAEFYTIPPAKGDYYQNWERQLVVHESRHVGQMSHFTKGLFKPLGWIFGEQITGLGVGVYASKWLLEGDAVIAETELSDAGRGRSASFTEYYRASFLSGEYRNWKKWRFGGYKQYTPNVYALGYVLNSEARLKSGNYLYSGEILDGYVKNWYNPNVINAVSERVAGKEPKGLFAEGVALHAAMWQSDFENRGPHTDFYGLESREGGYYVEYKSPVEVGKDSVVCIKYSYNNPTALVMVEFGGSVEEEVKKEEKGEVKEKILRSFTTSTSNLERIGRKLFWTENIADVRWGKESFNDLYCYDLDTRKTIRLSHECSYNNPKASACGSYLSVVEYPLQGGSNLVILNAATAEKTACYKAPYNGQLTESVWLGDTIYSLAVTERGLGLFSMDAANPGEWQYVIEEQPKAIRSLSAANGKLYFESDIDGVNNIYEFDPHTETLTRVVNSKFGAHDPHISGNRVYYSNLHTEGILPGYSIMDGAAGNRETAPYVKGGKVCNTYNFMVADTLSAQADRYFAEQKEVADAPKVESDAAQSEFEVKRYRKGTHLFRFHSWAPVYYNVDKIMSMSFDHFYDMMALGATAYSQNTLGTAVTMLGYSYHKGFHAAHASFEYSGLLPVFKVMADYNMDKRHKYSVEYSDSSVNFIDSCDGKPLLDLTLQAYIPLNFSSHGWQRGLIPQVVWKYTNNAYYSNKTRSYANKQQVAYAVRYYQMRPVANAAIFPKWGFSATFSGEFVPKGREYFGSAISLYSYFYFPGIMKRQGLRLSVSYQKQFVDDKMIYLDNLVSMPRGHEDYYGTDFYKFTADYAIPVNLNGLSLGFVAYLKRMQIIPFADIAGVKRPAVSYSRLYSYGTDILFDAIVFNIGVPVTLGMRYARTNNAKQRNHFGFLANISLP